MYILVSLIVILWKLYVFLESSSHEHSWKILRVGQLQKSEIICFEGKNTSEISLNTNSSKHRHWWLSCWSKSRSRCQPIRERPGIPGNGDFPVLVALTLNFILVFVTLHCCCQRPFKFCFEGTTTLMLNDKKLTNWRLWVSSLDLHRVPKNMWLHFVQ